MTRQTEADFQRAVLDVAGILGWRHYHTRFAIGSQTGYPDLTLWHPRRGTILLAELKTDTGQLSQRQRETLTELECVTRWGGAHLWRPSDWPAIERLLKGT